MKKQTSGALPGGPVVKTPRFPRRGADSIPGQGTKMPTCQRWEAKKETTLREM